MFVDESGDFGPYCKHSPYYILSVVFHDQRIPIDDSLQKISDALSYVGFEHHAVHTAPLIRREADYIDLSLTERRKIFMLLYNFVRTCDIRYTSFTFEKKEADNGKFALVAEMSRALNEFLQTHQAFFADYEELIIYYDNGQSEINMLLNAIFHTRPVQVTFRRVLPVDYRLFQAADLICTMTLLKTKKEAGTQSSSEKQFLTNKDFKTMMKTLQKKALI